MRSSMLLLDLEIGDGQDGAPPPLTPIQDTTVSRHETRDVRKGIVQVHREPSSQHDISQGDTTGGQTSTPKPQGYRVKRHINTERKMIDWGMSVGKKWLIIGDSNLSRFPGYSIPDLQIESYPGANFRHAQALMAKSSSHVTVEKVVLSFGLNCRGQRAKETSIKQMQAAVRTAKKRFPYAEIWIPMINYSTSLSSAEQINLQILNAHISKNMPFIPALKNIDFDTERDHIHWTRATARAILDHWISYLNLDPL